MKNSPIKTDAYFAERITKRHIEEGIKPVYTLAEYDKEWKGIKVRSFYLAFMECVDEYDAAIKLFGSKAVLDRLMNCKWFMNGFPGYSTYRGFAAYQEDMRERDLSIAKKVIMEKAMEGDIAAAKKLFDSSKPKAQGHGRGRPKDSDIAKAAADSVEEQELIKETIDRMNVVDFR